MGSATSALDKSDPRAQVDPWYKVESENFVLDQPNLNELKRLIVECSDNDKKESVVDRFELCQEQDSCDNQEEVTDTEVFQEKHESIASGPKEQTLEEFKEELRLKRMARQGAIADLRDELADLRKQLNVEREINRRLRDAVDNKEILARIDEGLSHDKEENADNLSSDVKNDVDKEQPQQGDNVDTKEPAESSRTKGLFSQLAEAQLALQLANAENIALSTELNVLRKQVVSLKEVIVCSKQMIEIREQQVSQLKTKLSEIEGSLAERELRLLSDNLRQEYDKQLANIRNLRQLYEERARVNAAERENLLRQISIKKDELDAETERVKTLEGRVEILEKELKEANEKISSFKMENNEYCYENKGLKEEMAVINQLFSQMLTGFNGTNNLDIDSLTTMLEENRALLNEMTTKELNSEGASLPKLLFDIVKQANGNCSSSSSDNNQQDTDRDNTDDCEGVDVDNANSIRVPSAQEIVGNLPKVWRVLIELLNHHKTERVDIKVNGQSEDCYKSVQTPTGTKSELSVSKTYIKLKDLILEKKALQKETNKLKTLNCHLEQRLNEQEKRLSTVSLELTKTWHLVGKMQRQHRQLHTHEQILRYQLQQKRRLLSELKEELELCRRKWAAAKAKNNESQLQWNDMRREFAKRKLQDANNSAESGYSDGPVSDDDEDSESLSKPKVVSQKTREIFETPRKIERVQSESPQRSGSSANQNIRRVNSAPPVAHFITDLFQTTVNISPVENFQSVAETSVVSEAGGEMATAMVARPPDRVAHASTSGTVPKQGVRLSRSKKRERNGKPPNGNSETLEEMFMRLSGLSGESSGNGTTEELHVEEDTDDRNMHRTARIHRLEEQCKSLIAEVIETSSCRDELNLQLTQFKNEMSPNQTQTLPPPESEPTREETPPSEEMGACGGLVETTPLKSGKSCLTAREEEYTAKRAERLRRLEEESQLLMSRIKRTTERGEGMKSLLDHIHSRCVSSREGSVDSSAGNDSSSATDPAPCSSVNKTEQEEAELSSQVKLTPEEEESARRHEERLKRLEEESKSLISKLSNTTTRGENICNQLDEIHNRCTNETEPSASPAQDESVDEPAETSDTKTDEPQDDSPNSGE